MFLFLLVIAVFESFFFYHLEMLTQCWLERELFLLGSVSPPELSQILLRPAALSGRLKWQFSQTAHFPN